MLSSIITYRFWAKANASLCIGLLLLLSLPLAAQVSVGARVDKQRILLGDQIRLELQLTYPAGTTLVGISDADLKGEEKIEIIKVGLVDTVSRDPQYVLQQFYTLTSFDSGYHYIPPFEVLYETAVGIDTARTNPIPLEVRNLPVEESSELQPIKNIIEEPRKLTDLLPYGIALLAMIGIIALVFFLRKRKVQSAPELVPALPPHIVAKQRLSELSEKELWQKGEIKGFQSELTYILRDYLEGRFKLPALESTTAEIDRAIKKKSELASWRNRINELLRTADLVKFAKAIPPQDIHQKALDTVSEFVDDTEPLPEPEPEKIDNTEVATETPNLEPEPSNPEPPFDELRAGSPSPPPSTSSGQAAPKSEKPE